MEPFIFKFALMAAAASIMRSSNPALAKKARQRPAQTTNQVAPTVHHAPPYDWQAGDCDVANKTNPLQRPPVTRAPGAPPQRHEWQSEQLADVEASRTRCVAISIAACQRMAKIPIRAHPTL